MSLLAVLVVRMVPGARYGIGTHRSLENYDNHRL